jgi:two-component system response regulator NreC
LSQREKEILRLISDGSSTKEIAEKLVISPSTVHTHHSNLMTKLGLNNRRELIQYARQRGLIQDK